MTKKSALDPKAAKPGRVLLALAGGTIPMTLLICGGLYSCSAPSREATATFFAEVRKSGKSPYPLDSSDAKDLEQTLQVVAKSTDFSVWNFQERGQTEWTRSCLLVRLSLPEGARWMDVALEKTSSGKWLVRDVSFERDCHTAKSGGDFRLR